MPTPEEIVAAKERLPPAGSPPEGTLGAGDWFEYSVMQQLLKQDAISDVPVDTGLSWLYNVLKWGALAILVVVIGLGLVYVFRYVNRARDEQNAGRPLPARPVELRDLSQGAFHASWLARLQQDPRGAALLLLKWVEMSLEQQGRGSYTVDATWREFLLTVPREDKARPSLVALGRQMRHAAYGPHEPDPTAVQQAWDVALSAVNP